MKKHILLITILICVAVAAHAQWLPATNGTDYYFNTGNIGIGTDTPTELLHVGGNILSNGSITANGNVQAGQFMTTSGIFNSTGNLSFLTGGTPRLFIQNTGYVGIGIAPTEMLHINGNVLSNQYTAASGTFNSNSNLFLSTNGTQQLSVLSANGFVGIGTSSPSQRLHINGGNIIVDNGASPTIFTGSGSTEYNRFLRIANSAEQQSPSGLKAGGLLISDNFNDANPGKNDLIVKGKVGIGTPLTSNFNKYTLAVNGTIGAKDMRVEKTSETWRWPDYVFQKNYNLPSLVEVESYIDKNKHLQDVPSAEEVEKNGHSLGDMDAILLKKVEELTLYIIEQQKQIDALKKQIDKKQ